jgi:hypothetical protein
MVDVLPLPVGFELLKSCRFQRDGKGDAVPRQRGCQYLADGVITSCSSSHHFLLHLLMHILCPQRCCIYLEADWNDLRIASRSAQDLAVL